MSDATSKAGKGPKVRKAPAKEKRGPQGCVTSSLYVHPKVLARVKKAATAKGESVSRFMIRVAEREAAAVLAGNCPTCGKPMHKTTKAKKEAA